MSSGGVSSVHSSRPLAEQAAANIRHPLSLTLLALTFSTGTVDAVSYLGLGHVFTANMTGNVVLLGFGLAGAGGLPIVAPIVSLAAFVVGSGFGGALARRLADRHRTHVGYALGLETALLAGAAIVAAATHPHPSTFAGDATIALMAAAMGIRNATVRRLGVPDLTTTVLTMTLTALAAESTIAGGSGKGTLRRGSAVVAMLAGAVAGALMLRTGLPLPLAFAAALAFATCAAYVGTRRRTPVNAKP
ncbi:MAG TPA: YoaK family protein [Solirubrobacteraceae bacterium]|nr:YoaK family protein [Solirubrobacteraceae bacterium]